MMFFAPLFLLGGVGVLVPIYVHLRNRHSRLAYAFPTMRFLVAARPVSHRLRTLMRWLVLLLRLLALALLILAFARPSLWAAQPLQGEAYVLVLDVSASMRAGTAWPEARDAARRFFQAHSQSGTRVAVVLMGRMPRALTSFDDPVEMQRSAVAKLQPTFEATDADGAIRLADSLLSQQSAAKREITVISDLAAGAYKRVAWDRPLSAGIGISVTPVGGEAPDNLGITEVIAPATFWNTVTPVTVSASVRSYASSATSVDVACFVGDAIAATQHLTLQPRESRQVTLSFTPGTLQPLRCRVAIVAADAFALDNERLFVLLPKVRTRLARLGPGPGDADVFMRAAVEPLADVAANQCRWLSSPELKGLYQQPLSKSADIVMWDQGHARSDSESQRISTFLSEGGAGIVLLSPDKPLQDWERKLLPTLQLGPERTAMPLSPEARFGQINFRHPIMRPFLQPRSGDLFSVNVLRHRSYSIENNSPVAELSNGDGVLSTVNVGKGRLAIFAMPLERVATDWPVHSTFLPIVHETIKWLEQSKARDMSVSIGDAVFDGKIVDRPGWYGSATDPASLVAANMDAGEGDLARWTLLSGFERLVTADPEQQAQKIAITNTHQQSVIAWWLLVGMAAFSVSELLISNRTPG